LNDHQNLNLGFWICCFHLLAHPPRDILVWPLQGALVCKALYSFADASADSLAITEGEAATLPRTFGPTELAKGWVAALSPVSIFFYKGIASLLGIHGCAC
jgi:hypothetical protein